MKIMERTQVWKSTFQLLNDDGTPFGKHHTSTTIRITETHYDIQNAIKAFASIPIRKLSFETLKNVAKAFYSEKVTEKKY